MFINTNIPFLADTTTQTPTPVPVPVPAPRRHIPMKNPHLLWPHQGHSCHRACSRICAATRQCSRARRTCPSSINTHNHISPTLAARHAYKSLRSEHAPQAQTTACAEHAGRPNLSSRSLIHQHPRTSSLIHLRPSAATSTYSHTRSDLDRAHLPPRPQHQTRSLRNFTTTRSPSNLPARPPFCSPTRARAHSTSLAPQLHRSPPTRS